MTSLIKITTWKHKDIKFSSHFSSVNSYIHSLFFLKISIYNTPSKHKGTLVLNILVGKEKKKVTHANI